MLNIRQCFLTNNPCYRQSRFMKPEGILVHTTGIENPYLKRYVQPDDGILGKNVYGNDWNREETEACVHAFIGMDKLGVIRCYQTLPWTMRSWGCAYGVNGSYNNNYIQFEICEGTGSEYGLQTYETAIALCEQLCTMFRLSADDVCGHYEAAMRGFASFHSDPQPYFQSFGRDMDHFRRTLRIRLSGSNPVKELQTILNRVYGEKLAIDGSYGPLTAAAVFRHYLYYRKPMIVNEHVAWLQRCLQRAGYDLVVDGSFGPITRKMVVSFQKAADIKQDGYAGPETHQYLIEFM